MFGKPIPLRQLMEEELYEAETKLLKAQSAVEWATANVTYETNRVARLKSILNATASQEKAYTPKIQTK